MSSNELKLIDQRQLLGKDFKIYGDFENPLFLAKDVADWIENLQPSQMVEAVDENEKLMCLLNTSGQNRNMWFLTEDGLYEVLMQSRKPIAKEFKRHVKQILKDIRKHGMYAKDDLVEKFLNNPDFAIDMLTKYKESKKKQAELEARIEEDKPKVAFADALEISKTSILVGEFAKLLHQNGLNIGQNRLFAILRQKGFLIKRGDSYNLPTQCSMNNGWLEIKESVIVLRDGSTRITRTTKVTGKGQIHFLNVIFEMDHNGEL